jgi:hypothetical protein
MCCPLVTSLFEEETTKRREEKRSEEGERGRETEGD